jgi:hypothetical protein
MVNSNKATLKLQMIIMLRVVITSLFNEFWPKTCKSKRFITYCQDIYL